MAYIGPITTIRHTVKTRAVTGRSQEHDMPASQVVADVDQTPPIVERRRGDRRREQRPPLVDSRVGNRRQRGPGIDIDV